MAELLIDNLGIRPGQRSERCRTWCWLPHMSLRNNPKEIQWQSAMTFVGNCLVRCLATWKG